MTTPHKHDPALPGQDPSIDSHRLEVHYLGAVYVTSHHVPNYMPRPLHLLIPWIDSFILSMNANRMEFPSVFNVQFPYSATTLVQMRASLAAGNTSRESLPGLQRFVTQWFNIILFGRPERVTLAPPRPETGMLPTEAATAIGIVGVIQLMVEQLRRQPNFNEALARQFGLLPETAPPVDPATLSPEPVTATFTGGVVQLRFRSAHNTTGVEMSEILCDRGDGVLRRVATTTHSRFTDFHELPAERTVWRYVIGFLDRQGLPVGVQSSAEVIVQRREQAGDSDANATNN